MNKLHIKKDDNVIVISGDDKGKKGKVIEVSPKEGKVIVEGVNKVHKHTKPRRQGDVGGIIEVDGPVYACKVQLYCSKCGAGRRSKVVVKESGEKIRACVKCGEEL